MFYTHIIHEQLPREERISLNAQGAAGKGNPLRSVIKDHSLSEIVYNNKKKFLHDKAKEQRGGILGNRNAQIRESQKAYDHLTEYSTDTMPFSWPMSVETYEEKYENYHLQSSKSYHILRQQSQNNKVLEYSDEQKGVSRSNGKQVELQIRNTNKVDTILGDNDWKNIRPEIATYVREV